MPAQAGQFSIREEKVMSILGAVYYEEFVPAQYHGEWVKEERYEYCDGFYEKTKAEKSWVLKSIAKVLGRKAA